MDLVCTPKSTISMMMTAYFVGVMLNCLYAHIPDRLGRRKSVIYGTGVSLIAQVLIMFFPSFGVRTFGFFVLGLSQIKLSQSYVWVSECVPMQSRAMAYTVINIVDASPMIVTCCWFLFVQREWFILNTIMLVVSFLAFGLAFICPESPRWLLVNGHREKSIETFNSIAAFNGSKTRLNINQRFTEEAMINLAKKKDLNQGVSLKSPLIAPVLMNQISLK